MSTGEHLHLGGQRKAAISLYSDRMPVLGLLTGVVSPDEIPDNPTGRRQVAELISQRRPLDAFGAVAETTAGRVPDEVRSAISAVRRGKFGEAVKHGGHAVLDTLASTTVYGVYGTTRFLVDNLRLGERWENDMRTVRKVDRALFRPWELFRCPEPGVRVEIEVPEGPIVVGRGKKVVHHFRVEVEGPSGIQSSFNSSDSNGDMRG